MNSQQTINTNIKTKPTSKPIKDGLLFYLQLDYKKTFKVLEEQIDKYNKKVQLIAPHLYKKHCLKSTHFFTMQVIFKMYAKHLINQQKMGITSDNPFKTNNVAIAKKRGANFNKATAWKHIKRLQLAGIITSKTWHGSNSSYELTFNPECLVAAQNITYNMLLIKGVCLIANIDREDLDVKISLELMAKRPLFADAEEGRIIVKNDHIDTRTEQELNYNTKSGIVNLKFWLRANCLGQNIQINNDFFDREQEHRSKSVPLVEPQCAENKFTPPAPPVVNKSVTTYGLASIVAISWGFAHQMLYPNMQCNGKNLSEREIKRGKELIERWYLKNLESSSKLSPGSLMKSFVTRVQLAKKFVEREPDRFIPLPSTYFHEDFSGGYYGTKDWKWENQLTKSEIDNLNFDLLNLRKVLRVFYKSGLTMDYVKAEQRIGKMHNPELLELFYKCVVDRTKYFNHQEFSKIVPSKYKKNHVN